jgi:signal-transduction protein with cAMP-binding, CBS, and nucleotidyltransferase domain/PAS domain-containing protein
MTSIYKKLMTLIYSNLTEDSGEKFTSGIVVSVVLGVGSIVLFIVSFYAIIIPMFERSAMERKKEMIHELTNTAWSVLPEYDEAYKAGRITLTEAKVLAAEEVGKMRYGPEQKNYFWITTTDPVMINHPYRSDLNGKNLIDFADKFGNRLFADAVNLVNEKGEGIVQYYWQKKDDASREVPKLSYVKAYQEWNWIVGTGIYLDDVRLEIKRLRDKLLRISILIIGIIIVILIYVLKQTRIIEQKRKDAVNELRSSNQRYKSLVGASTEGTLMVVERKVVFANSKFISLLDNETGSLVGIDFSELFKLSWDEMVSGIKNPNTTYAFETELLKPKAGYQHIVAYVTQVEQSDSTAYIVVIKNITEKNRLRLDTQKLSEDVQLSLQLMNQPVKNLVNENIYCDIDMPIGKVIALMKNKRSEIISVTSSDETVGVLTDKDIRNRLMNSGITMDSPVVKLMTSPVISINQGALLYEAVLLFREHNISHLMVTNHNTIIYGNISYFKCLEMQNNSLTFLMQEIQKCDVISDIRNIYNKVPVLIQAIFTSTDNISSVSRIITSIADAVNKRVIEMAIAEVGQAPCEFAFIAMGSEGRGEQTLKTDQDNAIIFAEQSDDNKKYFLRLSVIINENLHKIGYARCEGDLMAGNPEWCNHIDEWKHIFSTWINNPVGLNVLDSSLFFDMRLVFGSEQLSSELIDFVYEELKDKDEFFSQLVKTVAASKPVFDRKRVDVKKLLIPIVGYLRTMALFYSIKQTNSMLRLNYLMAYDLISERKAQEIEKMYNFLMHLRIKWQVSLILDKDWPSNTIPLIHLTAIEQETLKNIIKEVLKLQEELQSIL